MPYQFRTTSQDETIFECPLERGQCTFTNPSTHRRCMRKQYISIFASLQSPDSLLTSLPITGMYSFAYPTTESIIVYYLLQTTKEDC